MGLKVREGIQEPIHYLESRVRFSFSKCDVQNYCIKTLAKDELQRFYTKLGYFEKYTWGMLKRLPREKGFSDDKKGTQAHYLLQTRMAECNTFGHFRVDGLDVNMRFFVGLREDLAYVLLIDREGKIQH